MFFLLSEIHFSFKFQFLKYEITYIVIFISVFLFTFSFTTQLRHTKKGTSLKVLNNAKVAAACNCEEKIKPAKDNELESMANAPIATW